MTRRKKDKDKDRDKEIQKGGAKEFFSSLFKNQTFILYWVIIGMLAVTMYYVSVIVDEIREEDKEEDLRAQVQRDYLINQHNQQTAVVEALLHGQDMILGYVNQSKD